MVVQWLRLCTPNAGCKGSIPGQGTKILHAMPRDQKRKRWSPGDTEEAIC